MPDTLTMPSGPPDSTTTPLRSTMLCARMTPSLFTTDLMMSVAALAVRVTMPPSAWSVPVLET